MGPGFGPPNPEMINKLKEPKPKSIKEVPRYLKNVFGGTFSRLFYIFKLVWEAKPLLLFVMLFLRCFYKYQNLIIYHRLMNVDLMNRQEYFLP